MTYSFGPGRLTPAVKALIWANVAMFVLQAIGGARLTILLGLTPAAVVEQWWIWQPVTYMFLHGGVGHLLFNMLALWMFGVELERTWGTIFFTRYYFVTGVGAAVITVAVALLPFAFADQMYFIPTVGASGAIYGLLVAYALYYPDRPIYMYLLFPVPAKYFVLILGAINFLMSIGNRGGVAYAAHLGGLVVGYLYLTRGRGGPLADLKYRYLRWRMSRMRRRFGVHHGGRGGGWGGGVH